MQRDVEGDLQARCHVGDLDASAGLRESVKSKAQDRVRITSS